MLRASIAAMVLLLASAAGAGAGPADGQGLQLRLGARLSGAQGQTVRVIPASMPSRIMLRTINGVAPAPSDGDGMLALLAVEGEEPELALSVSDSVSLGLGYEYLRREDLQLDVAETASLRDEYSTHNVVLRAHWRF